MRGEGLLRQRLRAADAHVREGRRVAVANEVARPNGEPLGTSQTLGAGTVGMGPMRRNIGRKR